MIDNMTTTREANLKVNQKVFRGSTFGLFGIWFDSPIFSSGSRAIGLEAFPSVGVGSGECDPERDKKGRMGNLEGKG